MADMDALKREETEEILDYPVMVTRFESGAEQRRLRHSQELVGFRITSPVRTQAQVLEYRNFFKSMNGPLTSFTFQSPIDNQVYTVRFESGTFKTTLRGGVYVVEFQLTRVI